MLQKVQFAPGFNKQVTATGGEGQWRVEGKRVPEHPAYGRDAARVERERLVEGNRIVEHLVHFFHPARVKSERQVEGIRLVKHFVH